MGTAITKKITRFWPVAVIFILWVTFAAPYIFRGRVPFPSTYLVTFFPPWNASYGMPVKNNAVPDVISQIFPWKKLTIDTWKQGQIPLWNPYSFSGTPHAANYQSAVFSPVNLLFFVFPFIDAWSIMILLQPLLAGLGMYLFLRRLSRSRPASLVASVGFMFCGFMTTWMLYGTLGYAIAFLPWALWAVKSYFIRDTVHARVVLTGSIVFSFLSGHFQISIYMFGGLLAYILYESIITRQYKKGLLLLFYSVLGLIMAFPQILPTLDAYRASTRSASFSKTEVIPWQYIITLFAPDYYGNPVTRNDWFGHYAEWSSYIGVVPFLLAMFAVWRNLKAEKRFFIILGVVALFLAYQTPLTDLLFRLRLPAISTSAASRIIVLWSFSLSVLASYGFDELLAGWKDGTKKFVFYFAGFTALLLGVLWAALLLGHPMPADHLIIAKRNFVLPSIIVLITVMLYILGFWNKKYITRFIVLCIVILTLADMYRFAMKWIPFESRDYIYPQEKSLSYLESVAGDNRIFGNIGNEVGSTFHIPLIEGYDALYQGRYAQFMNASSNGIVNDGGRSVVQFDKHGKYKTDVLQLLGVRYIYHRLSDGRNIWAFPYWEYLDDASMKQIYNDTKYEIFEYDKAFPRAFLASSYVIKRGNQEIIDALFSPALNRRETLVLEEKPVLEPLEGSGSARISAYSPTRVRVETSAATSKLLFLSDVFDPGWHAYIDGKETPIYRADYDFRAVAIPSGNHTIDYSYIPGSLVSGLAFSGIALVITVVMSIL